MICVKAFFRFTSKVFSRLFSVVLVAEFKKYLYRKLEAKDIYFLSVGLRDNLHFHDLRPKFFLDRSLLRRMLP